MKQTSKIFLIVILTLLSFTAEAQQLDGKASYYSSSLHGRRMANGTRYDRNALTCAHKTLPFGTMLRVTNLNNGNTVVVEVTDRGPFVRGRVVDLSYRAASELGMLGAGVVRVRVDVLPPGATVPYRTDEDNPLELPEGMEAGLAGVCYEFIPEWEKPQETELKTVPRKVQTHPATRSKQTQPSKPAQTQQPKPAQTQQPKPAQTQQDKPAQQSAKATQPQRTAQSKAAQPAQKEHPRKQQEGSSAWSSFFKGVKEMFD